MVAGGIATALAILGLVLLCLGMAALASCWLRFMVSASEPIYGDVVCVPEELRLPGRKAGEGPSMAGEPLTGQVAHHDRAASK